MEECNPKPLIRRQLRDVLSQLSEADREVKSSLACGLLAKSPEFALAKVVMLFLSMPNEINTAPLALRCWQTGKTVVVPKVSWSQRRMLPVEVTCLQKGMTTSGLGVPEPVAGAPIPVDLIDLVVVPGLGFDRSGHRIGRGMGFYDRFLAQPEFIGLSCGLCFEEQLVDELPVLEHDVPLSMIVTDQGVRRYATNCIQRT